MLTRNVYLLAGTLLALGLGLIAGSSAQDVKDKSKIADQREIGIVVDKEGNAWQCEPLLVYDVSGGTLLGSVHKSLTLYNNGRVSFAEFGPQTTPRNDSRVIRPEEAARFTAALIGQNALTLTDQRLQVMDVPLQTLSVFQGTTDAMVHTFSFWGAHPDYAAIEQLLDAFIEKHFSTMK